LPATTPQTVAEHILSQLYQTNGNFKFKKPGLVITPENKKVAAYVPSKNTIYIDEKVYGICRSFGRDSLSALAFIIGHELAHAFQSEIRENKFRTNFLAYDKNYSLDIQVEKVADIQGIFNAYVAGYNVMTVTPLLIDQIYTEYGLKGKNLPGYPSLEARKGSCAEALAVAENLIDVFEASNYLLVIGKPSLAGTGYEYILQYYQGREIYNNIGLSYALSAQDYWDPATDHFLYPMEADWQSKIDRSVSARGMEKADAEMVPLRNLLLLKAEAAFKDAIQSDPSYIPAKINLVCVLDMLSRPEEALRFYDKNLSGYVKGKSKIKNQQQQLAELALGITYALLPDAMQKAAAAKIFKDLEQSSSSLVALYGRVNGQNMKRDMAYGNDVPDFQLPEMFRQLVYDMTLPRTADLTRLSINQDLGISFLKKHESETSTFVFANNGGNIVSLIKFKNRRAKNVSIFSEGGNLEQELYHNIVAAKDGFYLKSPGDKVVLKIDGKGRVLEMVRYFEH